jgi:hypothetical protein
MDDKQGDENEREGGDAAKGDEHVSGKGEAVDHDRQPGVPPETNEDVCEEKEDLESAQSFPASDPPANY